MYLKLFTQILDSSIADDRRLRHFFTDFMLCADLKGIVMMTEAAIARRIGATIEEVRWGIAELEKPDPMSKTTDNEGRRIERMEGHGYGWRVINFEMYHAMKTAEEMREKTRIRVQNHRAARKAAEDQRNTDDVTPCNAGNESNTTKTHTKTDTQTNTNTKTQEENMSADADVSDFFTVTETPAKKKRSAGNYPPEVIELWNMFPPMSCTRSCKADFYAQYRQATNKPPHADLVRSVAAWARCNEWTKNNGQYAPGAHLFFKNRKWESDPVMYSPTRQKGTIENIQLKILNGPDKNV